MKNKQNLSVYNQAWLSQDNYDYQPNFVSATSLLKEPREVALDRFSDPGDLDVIDMISIQLGNALHDYRERTKFDGCLIREERMYKRFGDLAYGLSGKPDSIDYDYNQPQVETSTGLLVIEDLKVSTTFGLQYKNFDDFVLQLSILRWLALNNDNLQHKFYGVHNRPIEEKDFSNTGIISHISRNWTKQNIKLSPSIIKEIPLELMPFDETESFIIEKLSKIVEALETDVKKMPDCSEEYKDKYRKTKCTLYCNSRFVCQKLKEEKLNVKKVVVEPEDDEY